MIITCDQCNQKNKIDELKLHLAKCGNCKQRLVKSFINYVSLLNESTIKELVYALYARYRDLHDYAPDFDTNSYYIVSTLLYANYDLVQRNNILLKFECMFKGNYSSNKFRHDIDKLILNHEFSEITKYLENNHRWLSSYIKYKPRVETFSIAANKSMDYDYWANIYKAWVLRSKVILEDSTSDTWGHPQLYLLLGPYWYNSSYKCENCGQYMFKNVFEKGSEFRVWVNGDLWLPKRAFTCHDCMTIHVPRPNYLLSEYRAIHKFTDKFEYYEIVKLMGSMGTMAGREV